jgi:hypothetical protein
MSNTPRKKAGFISFPKPEDLPAGTGEKLAGALQDIAENHPDSYADLWERMRLIDIASARVDPHARHGLFGQVFGPIIVFGKRLTNRWAYRKLQADAATLLINEIVKTDADTIEGVFKRIVEMKREFEAGMHHRNSRLVDAFFDYWEQTGRPPIKRELREFVCARPELYPGFPDQDDLAAWSPIYKAAGIPEDSKGVGL